MEPFDVHCETCHARLRVRQERFVGEIHPCPKCGSMVHIAAPVSPIDAAEPVSTAHAAAGVGLAARLAGVVGRHAVAWSTCGAVLVVSGSLATSLMVGGVERVVARTDQAATPAVSSAAADADSIPNANGSNDATARNESSPIAAVAAPIAAATAVDEDWYDRAPPTDRPAQRSDLAAGLPPLPALRPNEEATNSESRDILAASDRSPPETPTASPPVAGSPDGRQAERTRTLRLDPLGFDSSRASLGNVLGQASPDAAGDYSAELDDVADVGAKPPAAVSVDVRGQLALQLEAIDVAAMTLADFIAMVAEMSAVPIKLDPAAGASSHADVTVRGQDVSLGELLDDVLAQHRLTRIERDGQIVVIGFSNP